MDYTGKILVAPPLNNDDFFEKSVVFLYDQTSRSTTGVIVNKPSNRTLKELCEFNDLKYSGREKIYIGGPVNPSALIMLHSTDWACSNTIEVHNDWRISSDQSMLPRLATGDKPRFWKLFLGMCGWTAGQLEGEIAGIPPWSRSSSWLIGSPTDELLFSKKSDKIWSLAISNCSQEMIDSYFTIS